MKPRTQFILAGAVLIALMTWAAARQGSRADSAGQSGGTCCPFLPMLTGMRVSSETNGNIDNGTLNPASATNLTPALKHN
jgi:hypothetical protein